MRRSAALLTLLALVLAAAACGDDAKVTTASPTTDDSSTTTSTTIDGSATSTTAPTTGSTPTTGAPVTTRPPASASGELISITEGGGFVPFGTDFASVPTVVLADGTTFAGAPTTMIYPGPAMNPVNTGTVATSKRASLIDAAKAAGLDKTKLDVGQPGITDVPTTTIRVRIDGVVHEHAIYALDFDGPGLTASQAATRAKVKSFVDLVRDASNTAANTAYKPSGYQLLSLPYDPSQDGEASVQPNHLDWPFADLHLRSDNACIELTGQRAATFGALLPQATQITVWRDPTGGAQYHLVVRAKLPVDRPC